jgi:solute carrier family 25 phosphate transporter 23/24/25/41
MFQDSAQASTVFNTIEPNNHSNNGNPTLLRTVSNSITNRFIVAPIQFTNVADPNQLAQLNFLAKSFLKSTFFSDIQLKDLNEESIQRLLESAELIEIPPGRSLIKQGEQGKQFYIIGEGQLNVQIGDKIVGKVREGEVVGLLSLNYNQPRSATLKVSDELDNNFSDTIYKPRPVHAYSISKSNFDNFMHQNPKLIAKVDQRRFLRNSLGRNALFRHIEDENQKEKLVSKFRYDYCHNGDAIIKRGEQGDKFYLLYSGLAAVQIPSTNSKQEVTVDMIQPGESMGEISLLYSVPRAATVTCIADVGCGLFSLDRDTFLSVVQRSSKFLKHVFFKFAKQVDPNTNERLMAYCDFVEAVTYARKHQNANANNQQSLTELSDHRLQTLFLIADSSGDEKISFAEFILLHSLLCNPNNNDEKTLLNVAFRLFDRDKNGKISKEEFLHVIKILFSARNNHKELESNIANLENDPFIVSLFGQANSDENREISYDQFEQLLKREELPSFLKLLKEDLQAVNEFMQRIDVEMPLSAGLASETAGMSFYANTPDAKSSSGAAFALPWKNLVAGGVSGALSRTAVSPLERLKLLFQMQDKSTQVKYVGLVQSLSRIYKEDGVKGFFRGNFTNVVRITPTVAFQFFFYDIYKRLIFNHGPDTAADAVQTVQRLICGGLAGSTACVLTYPLDFIRARLTVQTSQTMKYKGIVDGINQVVRAEGIRGLYRGLWPSLAGIFPFIGMDFAFYEYLRQFVPKDEVYGRYNNTGLLLAGGTAGILSQSIAYPLDLIRRRMQVQGFAAAAVNYQYNGGIFSTMRIIYRAEGIAGLYQGMAMNLLKVAPSISISFLVYERCREFLHMEKPSKH